jgi:hypothetical protein
MITPINSMRAAVMVWLGSFIFFLFSLANNLSASHDSINYLLHIVKGDHLFHQHHLLYNYLANIWLHLLQAIFPSVPRHQIVESFTALWGSSVLSVAFLFFRNRFNLPIDLAMIGVFVIAFSFGMWFYSTNVEVYMPPMFFILCCLYLMTSQLNRTSDSLLVGALHSGAVLFHQVNILFLPVVMYWLYSKRKQLPVWKCSFGYALVGILITGGVYFIIGRVAEGHRTPGDFLNWVLGYTAGHDYWRPLSLKTPFAAATGFARSFIGGHFIFQHPVLQAALERTYRSHQLKDEMFLVRNIPEVMTWTLSLLTISFIFLMLRLTLLFVQRFRKTRTHFPVVKPLLLCIAVYSLFFCFWMPEILEFWILQMVLVWLLLVGTASFYLKRTNIKPMFLTLFVLLFVINYFGSMRWLGKFSNDWYYVETQKLDSSLTANDVVIVENNWILKDYVRYFSKARVVATDDPGFDLNFTRILISKAVASNRKVFVYRQSVIDGANGRWESIQSY